MFYDHPLLGLYFLGDASDGSTSGQLAFRRNVGGCSGAGNPGNLNAITNFPGTCLGRAVPAQPCSPTQVLNPQCYRGTWNYRRISSNLQETQAQGVPQSIFLNQNYLNPSTFLPLGFQPFGYPQAKNFRVCVLATGEPHGRARSGRRLRAQPRLQLQRRTSSEPSHQRQHDSRRFDGRQFERRACDARPAARATASPFTVSGCNPGGTLTSGPYVDASLMNFFRPGGLNPSIAAPISHPAIRSLRIARRSRWCRQYGQDSTRTAIPSPAGPSPAASRSATWTPTTPTAVPSITASAPTCASASPSTTSSSRPTPGRTPSTTPPTLQSTLTPQDSYYPGLDRSTSLFDQRHRFVFSGVYQTGKLSGSGFGPKFSATGRFAPLIEFGRTPVQHHYRRR
jgi:hypothetical protein